jgi:Tat protein translocase TatB subunit
MGWAEVAVILIVAVFVFGPDKLPHLAKQAGSFLRTARQMMDNAKNDLTSELGDEYAAIKDLNLRDLNPRSSYAVRSWTRWRPSRRSRPRASGRCAAASAHRSMSMPPERRAAAADGAPLPTGAPPYEIVLFGATGFTGGLTADYLAGHAPRDLRWAIAGRSRERLEAVADRLHQAHPDIPGSAS